jgi:hypothetical protein
MTRNHIVPVQPFKIKEGNSMGRPKKEKPNHGDLYEVKATIGKAFDGTLERGYQSS